MKRTVRVRGKTVDVEQIGKCRVYRPRHWASDRPKHTQHRRRVLWLHPVG